MLTTLLEDGGKELNKIYSLIQHWVDSKFIPDAVIQVQLGDSIIGQRAFGNASIDTLFDVASLTKVTATLPSLLLLEQRSKLSFNDKLVTYIPEFAHPEVTILQCLQHTTGLPGSLPYPQNRYSTKDVWQEIFAQPLLSKPGEEIRYSDIGMILAGLVAERVSNESLSTFAKRNIFQPLGMKHTQFLPDKKHYSSIAPTEWDEVKQRYLQGEVHDEISFRLGGVSGSAGLFSTASDLSIYAQAWLYPDRYPMLTPQSIKQCISSPISSRGLGWQVQDFTSSPLSCGLMWPKGSFGHTGFTGSSLWIEPTLNLSVVFLTNAVHYGRNSVIMELRKVLHESIYETIKKEY